MASLWFSPNNLVGKLESPSQDYLTPEGFNLNTRISFKAQVYVDSANANGIVPLFSTVSDGTPDTDRYTSLLTIENGIVRFQAYDRDSLKIHAIFDEPFPFDQMVEVDMQYKGSYPGTIVNINGVPLTINTVQTNNNVYFFWAYFKVTLGGIKDGVPQAKGVLFANARICNDDSMPAGNSTNDHTTIWEWNFEDETNPYKIKTSRNNVQNELVGAVTYPVEVVWTSGNTPPADTGGGSGGGGIVVPGNGNTTQVQGSITENDLPVARRVFAITEAELTIDGSQQTTQAVLSNTVSSDIDGSYTLDTSPYEGSVMVIASDDYGLVWQASTDYVVGDVIRPPTFQGYVYHCTLAGTGDATEPVWWFDTSSAKTIGTAQFQAKPFSRPLAHGPIIPTIVPAP